MNLKRVEIIVNLSKFNDIKAALSKIGVTGMTVSQVLGCGVQKGTPEHAREEYEEIELRPKQLITIFTTDGLLGKIIATVKDELYTGHIGDGKIFVSDVSNAIRVRTGEEGLDAI
ncbi:MAG: P-II family nitrogen regulator [Clostridiales bacterium]|jgi:nitrogen regulatory protein PII|nr:P-II family nitrogen regulator [Clostridiales bacterium]